MRRLYANNARCRLGADITTTGTITEIVLDTGFGSLFPLPTSGNFFILTITDALYEVECFLITGRVGDILTVGARAQEGTIAKTFTALDPLVFAGLNPTRGAFERIEDHTEGLVDAHDASAISYAGASGLSADDVEEALDELDAEKAPLASPALTGNPTAPTQTAGNNSTRLATTAFIQAAVAAAIAASEAIHVADAAGMIYGLQLSNDAGDPTHDINITSGRATSSTLDGIMILPAEITKRIDASWAVGNDQGGMDTGSVATSTWYAVWLIRRSDTGVVDALFSLSASAPTMPTNYDQKRRIGWVRRSGSGANLRFSQFGDRFTLNVIAADVIAEGSSLVAHAITLTAPPHSTARFSAVSLILAGVSDSVYTTFYETTQAALTPGALNAQLLTQGDGTFYVTYATAEVELKVSAASTINVDSIFTAGGAQYYVGTHGWTDERGKSGQ
ncbi:MAG: hypothetical protein ACRD0K_20790 [Egibacteraceae bacterium]